MPPLGGHQGDRGGGICFPSPPVLEDARSASTRTRRAVGIAPTSVTGPCAERVCRVVALIHCAILFLPSRVLQKGYFYDIIMQMKITKSECGYFLIGNQECSV
jgi:hypothetical protein